MKTKKPHTQTLKETAKSWGIDYQTYRIKAELIDVIRSYCNQHKISQRKLAERVEGLTQDRVSKIFSGQVGHMTIDKLISILSALGINASITAKAILLYILNKSTI